MPVPGYLLQYASLGSVKGIAPQAINEADIYWCLWTPLSLDVLAPRFEMAYHSYDIMLYITMFAAKEPAHRYVSSMS